MVSTPSEHERWMQQALALARRAEQEGEVPVGAVLVAEGEVVAEGWNRPIVLHDPTAHAEIQAMRAAAIKLGNYRLPGTTLYVTLEPCAMCAGAMIQARIGQLVFGCSDLRSGAAGTIFNVVQEPSLNHRVEVVAGILETECRETLQQFFRRKRKKPSA